MSRWNRDLQSRKLIVIKGFLMLLCGILAGVLLYLRNPDYQTLVLVGCLVFGACRFYYFLFHVIEKYVDDSYRFRGVFDALKFLASRREK